MGLKNIGLTLLACMVPAGYSGDGALPRLELRQDPLRPWAATVALVGLPREILNRLAAEQPGRAQGIKLFPVYFGKPAPGKPAMLGTWTAEAEVLTFSPRFPFEPGESYRAEAHLAALYGLASMSNPWEPTIAIEFAIPEEAPPEATATVTGVFPSGDRLPANLLRFYIHFSEPIAYGGNYRRIRLLDGEGGEVADAFLETPELWDPDGRRLTLFFHPGRIKRGLTLHDNLGLALEPGRRYSLVVGGEIRDLSGRPLRREHRKTFSVSEEDRSSPNPGLWRLDPPPAGGSEPLTVRFDEPMDRALLFRLIRVQRGDGLGIEGSVKVSEEEILWSFLPARSWTQGSYKLVVSTALEDRAGNRLQQLFDAVSGAEPKMVGDLLELPFVISAPGTTDAR